MEPEQSRLWPSHPDATCELELRLARERSPRGHASWRYDVGAWHVGEGPLLLATGYVPPFVGPDTLGAASHRLVSHWWRLSSSAGADGHPSLHREARDALAAFYAQLELRRPLQP